MRMLLTSCALIGLGVVGGCQSIVTFDGPTETGQNCADGVDNDGDGKIDCADDSCATAEACANQAPAAVDDALTTNEDVALTIPSLELTSNDSDREGDALSITAVGASAHGTAVLAGGVIAFTPEVDFDGEASFEYTVSDGELLDTGKVTITVTVAADAPVAVDDAFSTVEDAVLTISPAAIAANDTDGDGDTLSITSVENPQHCTVAFVDGEIAVTPDADFDQAASFDYTVSDGSGADVGHVVVDVMPINDAPAFASVPAGVVIEDEQLVYVPTIRDVDGPTQTWTVDATDTCGGTIVAASGRYAFTPIGPKVAPTCNLAITVCDGGVPKLCSSQSRSVVITAVNDAPLISSVAPPTATEGIGYNYFATVDDADGPQVVWTVQPGDTCGGTIDPDSGFYTFVNEGPTPPSTCNIVITVCDQGSPGLCGAQLTTIAVTAVNDPPIAANDTVFTPGQTAVNIRTSTLLLNDADPEGEVLTFLSVQGAVDGTVSLGDTVVEFIPATGFSGDAQFTYTIRDAGGATASATVVVTVGGFCGDSITDFISEECDDGNTNPIDGCDLCRLPLIADVPAQVISGDLVNCSTATSNTGRKISSDALGRFYAAMNCDGQLFVAVSNNFGRDWSAPVATGISDATEYAVEGGPTGVAYLVAASGAQIRLTRSTNAGVSWESAQFLEAGNDDEVSIDSFGDDVYIAVSLPSGLAVYHNANRGVAGGWTSAAVSQNNVFHDVFVDKLSGGVIIASGDPAFRIRESADNGVTFGAEIDPPGQAFFSDWAGSSGVVYAIGSSSSDGDIDVIPLVDPAAATSVSGLTSNIQERGRSIDADPLGNAYVATQQPNGNIQLDRLKFQSGVIRAADVRTIAVSGTQPSVAGLPNSRGALVVWTEGSQVFGAVRTYGNLVCGTGVGTTNEGGLVTVTCAQGETISEIRFASFGTPTGSCPTFTESSCHASTSASVMATACVGLNSCNVLADAGTFGDPCGGVPKHLLVTAFCD